MDASARRQRDQGLEGDQADHAATQPTARRGREQKLPEPSPDRRRSDDSQDYEHDRALVDANGDKIFSSFDPRDLDKSQPDMNCGTPIITGGTGKYAGITGSEPFACNSMPALAGASGYTARDIPHNTSWEIKE